MQKILLLCAVFILASCQEKEKKALSPLPSLTKPILTSSKGGKKTWRLTSEMIKMKGKKTHLYDVKFELFKDEKIVCIITGKEGEIAADKITLSGNVIASTNEGATLTTHSINFEGKTNSLSTDDPVCFIKNNLILKGNGFIANRDLNEIIIKKDVEVFLKI